MLAKLVRLERKCRKVCDDDDPPVCHSEAVLRASRRADGAVGVLPGTPRIETVSQMKAVADQQIERPQDWVKAGAITDGTARYSWEQFPDGVFLTSNYSGRNVYSPEIKLSACTLRPVVPFTVIACGSAELLYEEGRGIAASFAEYGDASVAPTVRLQLDGKDAVLLRFGIKGEMVVALLVKDQSGWQLKYRWADYPLIC